MAENTISHIRWLDQYGNQLESEIITRFHYSNDYVVICHYWFRVLIIKGKIQKEDGSFILEGEEVQN